MNNVKSTMNGVKGYHPRLTWEQQIQEMKNMVKSGKSTRKPRGKVK